MLPATLQTAAGERRCVTDARGKAGGGTCAYIGNHMQMFRVGQSVFTPAVFSFLQNLSAGDQTPAWYILSLVWLQLIFGPLPAASPMKTQREKDAQSEASPKPLTFF